MNRSAMNLKTAAVAAAACGILAAPIWSAEEAKKADTGKNPPAKTGVVMAVVIPERIAAPARGGETKFEIGLRIANRSNQYLSFDLFDTVRPVLRNGQGRELPLDGGRNATRIAKPIEVQAGQTNTVSYAARLSIPEGKTYPQLVVDDRTGGVWAYHDLEPGRFTLRLEYAHPPAGRVAQAGRWVGATTTAPADFLIGRAPADEPADGKTAPEDTVVEMNAKMFQKAPVVLRVKLLSIGGGADKYAWYEVEILKVLKNESGETFGQKLKIAAFSRKPGVPEGESTVYLERYNATDKGLWKLFGGGAATGVSHVRK